ncbi:MAG: DUF5684 domain-containing protein [Patescibacteria group bacterium]
MDLANMQDANAAALAGVMSLVSLIASLVIYVYFALCLTNIAKKTNTPDGWWGWVPILNFFLMVKIADKQWWWVLLFLVPLVNVIMMVIVWMKICEKRGKPGWWGILMLVPIANFIVPGILAFGK